MRRKTSLWTLMLALSLIFWGFGLPKNIEKKVNKEVAKTFEVDNFSLTSVAIPAQLQSQLPCKITADNLYRIEEGESLYGYAYVDKAPSKTAEFDYLVLFNKDLEIVRSRVLIYREEYGGEIGSNRWLKQFEGKNGQDRVSHETNIDGISGATISVRSMTQSMDKLLQAVGILQENKVL